MYKILAPKMNSKCNNLIKNIQYNQICVYIYINVIAKHEGCHSTTHGAFSSTPGHSK